MAEKKSEIMAVRVSQKEREEIEAAAEYASLAPSVYLRHAALQKAREQGK